MSEIDRKALEANFAGWRAERAPDLPEGEAFELYTIGLILKDADLSDEETASGHLGGGNDGGIDGFYFFLNRQLMQEETETPNDVSLAHLWIIQAKSENGFGEKAIDKMRSFSEDLFDFSKPIEKFKRYNQSVKDAMNIFRTHYEAILAHPHKLHISYVYATRSDKTPSDQVVELTKQIEKVVKSQASAAEIDFQFWGARDIVNAFRTPKEKKLSMNVVSSLATPDGSFICFVKLKSLAEFLTDEKTGEIRQYVLDPNVRDFQGPNSQVNKDIRATLGNTDVKEFWWLNNGITILADEPSIGAGKITVSSPELVNGLQTSYLVFDHFKNGGHDDRTVMVRVIAPPDEQTRRKIIRATNNQNSMNALSLHATDDVHYNIEELFRLKGLYYDRRKGQSRREKRPISKILNMKDLAQAVIAIILRRPADARARPETLLKKEGGHDAIFDPKAETRMFLACALLDRQIKNYLGTRSDLSRDVCNDIRFYIDMWVAAVLVGRAEPSSAEIAKLTPSLEKPVDEKILKSSCDAVLKVYLAAGGDDKAAKGQEMPKQVLSLLKKTLPSKKKK